MMVGREERDQGVFVLTGDNFQTERHCHGGPTICRLRNFTSIVNFRKLIAIERFMSARQREKRPILIENRSNAFPCMVEQALSFKEPAELFRPPIAGDLVSHLF